ncbi:hypothetical protein BKA62DRAFT_629845 [Auriculariales sp. MPI-PUGE-AT-0066]|nr:hypothetical protein BKA62DRAFT_629845 [Auriculariales sp. MPI-PUGE-AT-0066]
MHPLHPYHCVCHCCLSILPSCSCHLHNCLLTYSCFQIRKFAVKVNNSTTVLLPLWDTKCKILKLKPACLRQNISTRCNSTYGAGVRTLQYCLAIDTMTGNCTMGLHEFALASEDWDLLEDLLELLKEATLFFLQANSSIGDVIPAMDHIDGVLADAMNNNTINDALCACANLSHRVMNYYYSLTDATPAYQIAMGECGSPIGV